MKIDLEQFKDCDHCFHTFGSFGCCSTVNNEWVYSCREGQREYWIDHVLEIIHQKGISNAYDRPSFWYNKGEDYKVIDTKYHRGYDQALADVEEEFLALRKENRNDSI